MDNVRSKNTKTKNKSKQNFGEKQPVNVLRKIEYIALRKLETAVIYTYRY